jgi:hypothetical protein
MEQSPSLYVNDCLASQHFSSILWNVSRLSRNRSSFSLYNLNTDLTGNTSTNSSIAACVSVEDIT